MPTERQGFWWLGEATLAVGGVLLLLAVFFTPALSGERVLYAADFSGSDLLEMNIPRRHLAAEAIRQGHLPHWTPLLGNGYPLLAEGQSGVFYPTTLPFFLALPLPLATNLTLLSTLAIALLGSYFLARVHGARPAAAAVSALAYGLGAVMVLRLKHLNLVQVISWLPASLACLELFLGSGRRVWALAAALIWTLQILAGHPHAAGLCALGVLLYSWTRMASGQVHRPARAAWTLIGAGLLSLLMSAIQWLPTAELLQVSLRGRAFTWQEASAYPFRPVDLLRLVHPFAGGNPANATLPLDRIAETGVFWESNPYVGLVPLLLVLAVPFLRRERQTAWLMGSAALCLALALGRFGGLYWLLWKFLPGFSLFRFPARFLILFSAYAALLAGLGAEGLLKRMAPPRARLVGGVLVALTALDLFRMNAAYTGYLPSEWFNPPATVAEVTDHPGRISTPTADQTWQRTWLLAGGWKGQSDLLLAHRAVLAPDASAHWGVAHHSDRILQEGGIELLEYAALQRRFREGMVPLSQSVALKPESIRLLERQNVSVLLSFFPLVGPTLDLLGTHQADARLPGPVFMYRTRAPVPRVRLVGQALPVGPDRAQGLDRLASSSFDPSGSTLLEVDRAEGPFSSGRARLLQDDGWAQEIEVDSARGGFLVVLDNWHPAWRASIDGVSTPVLRADVAFRAVRVPPGRHVARFWFESQAFCWGSRLSLAAWVGWMALLFLSLRACRGTLKKPESRSRMGRNLPYPPGRMQGSGGRGDLPHESGRRSRGAVQTS